MRRSLFLFIGLFASCGAESHRWGLHGNVVYRSAAQLETVADQGARVWVFTGAQEVAREALVNLQNFEKRFPRGIEKFDSRPEEMDALKSAMVLMTYHAVHKKDLLTATTVNEQGQFSLALDAPASITLLIESANTQGSYHQKRYSLHELTFDKQPAALSIDFGASHLEGHEPT